MWVLRPVLGSPPSPFALTSERPGIETGPISLTKEVANGMESFLAARRTGCGLETHPVHHSQRRSLEAVSLVAVTTREGIAAPSGHFSIALEFYLHKLFLQRAPTPPALRLKIG